MSAPGRAQDGAAAAGSGADSSGGPGQRSTVLAELVGRPLQEIAEEMAALRIANAKLAAEVDLLRPLNLMHLPELAQLRKKHAVFTNAVKFFVRQSEFVPAVEYRSPRQLPSDIVRLVIEEVTGPPYEHSAQLWLGPRSPWIDHLRFRKNLPLVCRDWWAPATSFLYEHISLRRMGQVSALLHTLTHSPVSRDLRSYVKSISVVDFLLLHSCADAVREDLRALLTICDTLHTFTYREHFNLCSLVESASDRELADCNIPWVPRSLSQGILQDRVASSLRRVELVLTFDSEAMLNLHTFLASTTSLVSLTLSNRRLKSSQTGAPTDLPPISLAALEELCADSSDFVSYAINYLNLPELSSLTVCEHASLRLLVQKFGQRLTYLHVIPRLDALYSDHLSAILDSCPLLEHLVAPGSLSTLLGTLQRCLTRPATSPRLRRLRYLDVYEGEDMYRTKGAFTAALHTLIRRIPEHASIPALARPGGPGVRVLPTGTGTAPHCDAPRIFHPAALALVRADGVRCGVLCGEPWVQTSWLVRADIDFGATTWRMWTVPVATPFPSWGDVEEPDDADFEPWPEDEYTDGTSCEGEDDGTSWISGSSDSDLSSACADEYLDALSRGDPPEGSSQRGSTAEQPLDRVELLEAFRRSQHADHLLLD